MDFKDLCEQCMCRQVCKYIDAYQHTNVISTHPYIQVRCSSYVPPFNIANEDKCEAIKAWRAEHPNGKKMECYRETGISRPTIDKYWISKNEIE